MIMILHIYRPRQFQWTWFGANRPISCWVMASTRFQEPSSRPWARPLSPHGQMTMPLQTYGPRQFQWTWSGVNQPSGCWVPASAKFREPLSCPWARPLCPHGQMTMTLHIYKPNWTWFGVNRFSGCWIMASANICQTDRWTDERTESIS